MTFVVIWCYINKTKLNCIEFLALSWTCLQCVLDSARAASCHWSCLWFSWTGSQGIVVEKRASGLVTAGLHLCFLGMMWFCWLLPARTFSSQWSGSQLSVKAGMKVSSSKSETMYKHYISKSIHSPIQLSAESIAIMLLHLAIWWASLGLAVLRRMVLVWLYCGLWHSLRGRQHSLQYRTLEVCDIAVVLLHFPGVQALSPGLIKQFVVPGITECLSYSRSNVTKMQWGYCNITYMIESLAFLLAGLAIWWL